MVESGEFRNQNETRFYFLRNDNVTIKQSHPNSFRVIFPVILLLLVCLGVLMSGCQSSDSAESVVTVETTSIVEVEVTREVFATVQVPVELTRQVFIPVTETPVPLGSVDRPIRLVFAPVTEATALAARSVALAADLEAASGLKFERVTPATYAEFMDVACTNSAETVVFMPTLAYPSLADQCDLQVQYTGLRDNLPWSASMILVEREGGPISELADLNDSIWGTADANDLINSLYFRALFAAEDINIASTVNFDSYPAALIAFENGDPELDFVTAPYVPPILPYDERPWHFGEDDPELWRVVSNFPRRSGQGFVVVSGYVEDGGYHIRDARSTVLDTATRIFIDTAILDLSAQMPNGAVAFGPDMPLGLANEVGAALTSVGSMTTCPQSLCAGDLFDWEGVAPVSGAAYDPVRFIIDQLNLDEEAIINTLENGQ